jgi:hypothetical protein
MVLRYVGPDYTFEQQRVEINNLATDVVGLGTPAYSVTAGYATTAGTATTATNLADAANITTGTINKDRISSTNSLSVLGDLYVSNNISFGGTTTQLNTQQLNIVDPDIVLGIGTSFSPTDNTANHGGIAIASTEGTPLVDLNIVPGETNPSTYKKIMWFKGSTIGAGLTDAWLFNYGVGIGSTQVPNGVRLAAGGMQVTDTTISTPNLNVTGNLGIGITNPTSKLAVVGNISVSGVSTFTGDSTAGNPPIFVRRDANNNAGIKLYSTSNGNFVFSESTSSNGKPLVFDTSQQENIIFKIVGVTRAIIQPTGELLVGTATTSGTAGITSTGTAGQGLQVAGISSGAYIGGNLGVGHTNPTSRLDVIGNAAVSGLTSTNNLNVTGISTLKSTTLIGGATSTGTASQTLQVTGGAYVSGSVGIGTTNPGAGVKLDVVGGEIKAGRVDSTNEGGQVSFGRATDNATGWYIDVYGNTSTPQLRFVDVSTASVRMTIDSAGVISGNGSGLTGIVATGSGIVVRDDGSNIGTATTINFGANLTASIAGGVATIDATGGGTATASIDLLEVMLFS